MIEILDDITCLHYLSGQPVGRLGFSSGALPVVFPVNYVLEGRTIVFGSEEGEKARAARAGAVACLEIDRFDTMNHDGWSVLATGRLNVVPESRADEISRLPVAPWAIDQPLWWIELSVELLSGRRISHTGVGT